MNLVGKQVLILGAGRSGAAAARLALREGARVAVHDQGGPERFQDIESLARRVPQAGVTTAEACDLLVVSPGIDTFGPLVAAYAAQAGEMIGETEFGSRYFAGTLVAITGTNGKTTTTELVDRILNAGGLTSVPCGNHGMPLSDVVMLPVVPRAAALEVSSFQLETIRDLRPAVSVWLNFAPDHLDRYPTVADYFAAKRRIFTNQRATDTAVVRAGEPLGVLGARVVRFSTEDPTADWYSEGRLICRGGVTVMDLADTRMRGTHNAENTMAAMAAGEALGIGMGVMRDALRGYAAPPHRCELVRVLDGVEYLNDSKATNVHALTSALRAMDRPVVLIAGGKDKGLDYRPALPLLRTKATAVVTFGQIGQALARLLAEAVPAEAASSLDDAVARARRLAPCGAVVLFSPGTSSFDMFSGYEQRGTMFRDLVNQLHEPITP